MALAFGVQPAFSWPQPMKVDQAKHSVASTNASQELIRYFMSSSALMGSHAAVMTVRMIMTDCKACSL